MKRITQALQKIDALSVRERIILFVLLLSGLWAVIDALMLAPQSEHRQREQQKLQAAYSKLAESEQLLNRHSSQPDPNLADRQRLESARLNLNARMKTMQDLQMRLVAPKDRVKVLQGLLAAQPGLRLASLETLPAESVGVAADAPTNTASPARADADGLFKHGVKLTLVGDYSALTRYMERLERLPVGFYWTRAELDAKAHPEIVLTLVLYTLSLEPTWLTV